VPPEAGVVEAPPDPANENSDSSQRRRRIRDAVEGALSDIILLGTDEQVRLAERAARDLVEGRPVRTHDLTVSLRNFIRKALDIDPIPSDLAIPAQGPARPSASGGRGGGDRDRGGDGGRQGGGRSGGAGGGMAAGVGGGMAGGMGMGAILGSGGGGDHPENDDHKP
jgi:hypothetical protein